MEKNPITIINNLLDKAVGQLVLGGVDWDSFIDQEAVEEPEEAPHGLSYTDQLHDAGLFDDAHFILNKLGHIGLEDGS